MPLLVPLVFAGLALVCSRWPSRQGTRESLVRAGLLFGAIVLLSTEALSTFDAITASAVARLWLALGVVAVSIGVLARVRGDPGDPSDATGHSTVPGLHAAVCATILGLTLLTAVVAPPNYPDSMTYHMARIAHWIQAGSVDWFPTADPRQNFQMPLAEFVILHLQLLSGGDRWANLVQWASFLMCGAVVSLVLHELGQPARIQWAGAIVAFTVPMAILQASGAQNDLVVSFWLLAFLLYLWRTISDRSWQSSILCGLALGLALATKGTAYLYAPAMGAALVVARAATTPRGRPLPLITGLVVALALAASLSLGIWSRSVAALGTPVCCGEKYFVERLTPGDMVSNVLRNAAVHLGIPKLRGVVPSAVAFLSPVDLDDPATTWETQSFVVYFSFHEGKAGNTLLLLVFLAGVVSIAADRRLRRGPAMAWAGAVVAGFLAYSLALKWQPWASRLQTPCFLVAAVPVAIALCARGHWIERGGLALLFAGAIPFLLVNQSRPLIPRYSPSIFVVSRTEQYYADRKTYRIPYSEAAAFLRESAESEIGLLFDEDDYEYPFWVMIKKDFTGPPLLRHVGVTGKPESTVPPPRLIVATRGGERHTVDGVDYVRVRDFGEMSVLRRARDAEQTSAGSDSL
jgi:4-amino-4-deoxy-L-arabinose transferase-like glycosyltransferase